MSLINLIKIVLTKKFRNMNIIWNIETGQRKLLFITAKKNKILK